MQDPKDTFEDIPLDTRHHTFKVKPKFPREWRITPERLAQLAAERQQTLKIDEVKALNGQVVDGVALIEAANENARLLASKVRVEEPVLLGKGKGKKLSIRR